MERVFSQTKETCLIACHLSDEAFKKRKTTIASTIISKIIQAEELENGYQFSFAYSEGMLIELAHFINVEKGFCPFINFHLMLNNNSNNVVLKLTGAEGTKEFIKYELEMA
jgi:hypothetical protein